MFFFFLEGLPDAAFFFDAALLENTWGRVVFLGRRFVVGSPLRRVYHFQYCPVTSRAFIAGVKESKAMFPRSTQTSSSTNSTSNGMRVKSRRATETGKWNRRGPALPGLMYRTLSRSNFPG